MFSYRTMAQASQCQLDRMLVEDPKGHLSYQAKVAPSTVISGVVVAWTSCCRYSQPPSASHRRASASSGSPLPCRIERSTRSTRRPRSAGPAARTTPKRPTTTPARRASRCRDHSRQGSTRRTRAAAEGRESDRKCALSNARQNQSTLFAPIMSRRGHPDQESVSLFVRHDELPVAGKGGLGVRGGVGRSRYSDDIDAIAW